MPADPVALFDLPDGAVVELAVVAPLSADRRRTLRQAAELAAGRHPLGALLHAEAAPLDDRDASGRRCGNCWYRALNVIGGVAGNYPKCVFGARNPTDTDRYGSPGFRVTRSAASDCRAWWPACTDHTWADPGVSADAARYVPERAS
jgi:hypothetical protein